MINKLAKYFLFSLCSLLLNSGISSAQLSWNKAAAFSQNSKSYLAIPATADLIGLNANMIEMWCYFTSINASFDYVLYDRGPECRLYYSGVAGLRAQASNSNDNRTLQGPILNANTWYHVAIITRDTVISSDPKFKVRELLVDGVVKARDWDVWPGGTLGTNTDSIKIGGYTFSGSISLNGYIDDFRYWSGRFFQDDVQKNMRTSLTAWGNGGHPYNPCLISLPFQKGDNSGTSFSVADFSRFNRVVNNRSVTAFSLSDRPSVTTYDNLSVHFNGSTDYVAGPDHLNNSPDIQLTMEAWVYPEKTYTGGFSDFGTIICKGLSNYNYKLFLGSDNDVHVTINGNSSFGYTGSVSAPANRWTHIAFTYSNSGAYAYYINGSLAGSGTNNLGNIVNGTDSLYIGQSGGASFFQGYIDEVRISAYTKSESEIQSFLHRGMDLNNRPGAFDLSCYNFDGSLANNNGGLPRLYFRNGAVFSSRYISVSKNFPVSPLVKSDNMSFPSAWYISENNLRIPASGTMGYSQYDTINIPYCMGILDVNVFLALNHTFEKDLAVYLISPSGDSLEMVKTNVMKRGQYITIFNDQADSSIVNDRFVTFSPQIKPFTSLSSVLTGLNVRGNWKLHVNDSFAGDTGMVYSWGLQFNNMVAKPNLMTFNGTANQGGFWTGSNQPTDTIRYILRNSFAPYTKVDSAIGYVNQFGFSTTYFANALNSSYYVEVKHRNSLSVWSNIPRAFSQGSTTNYNFLAGPGSVYGGELISINGRWCMYSGDINQDGNINGNDFTILNQQFGLSGYLASDLNGDNTVNGNDFTILNTGYGKQTNHP